MWVLVLIMLENGNVDMVSQMHEHRLAFSSQKGCENYLKDLQRTGWYSTMNETGEFRRGRVLNYQLTIVWEDAEFFGVTNKDVVLCLNVSKVIN